MKLFELKSTINWKWDRRDSTEWIATFLVDIGREEGDTPFIVEFHRYGEGNLARTFRHNQEGLNYIEQQGIKELWNLVFGFQGDYTIETKQTGTGSEMVIFSAVFAIMDAFIREKNPNGIFFESDLQEPTRVRLYHRVLGMLKKYRFKTFTSADDVVGMQVYLAHK